MIDRRIFLIDPQADLEGKAIFTAERNDWGFWSNHRIEVEIRNVDTNYSTSLRT